MSRVVRLQFDSEAVAWQLFQSISRGTSLLTSGSSERESWDFVTHGNALLQSLSSNIPNHGTFLIWNFKDSCVTAANVNFSTQLRRHGSLKSCTACCFGVCSSHIGQGVHMNASLLVVRLLV